MSGKHVKVIIDTNLWISFLIGLKSSSVLRSILTDGKITIVMTDILQQEIMTVASRPKFSRYFEPDACERLLSFLRSRSEFYPLGEIPQRCRDSKDDYLLELARVSDADILVSGDEDLIEMKRLGHCHIITLSQLKKALKK